MNTPQAIIIEIYTEYTPNPESLKFVANKMLLPQNSVDFREGDNTENAPLATALFELSYVGGVFISNNFVTLTKKAGAQWEEIIPEVKEFLKQFIGAGKTAVTSIAPPVAEGGDATTNEIESKIKSLLDTYVKPAVEMDGGAIQFKSFDEGVVTLLMQGACNGCPSSTLTLKSGIEGLLKRMVPEVKEVVAQQDL